jgi:hypothetical protein
MDDEKACTAERRENFTLQVARTVNKRGWEYAGVFDHGSEILAYLYPDGISPKQYPAFLNVVRTIDKLFEITTRRRQSADEDPWTAIAAFAIQMAFDKKGYKTK